jgi:hypothetical protein
MTTINFSKRDWHGTDTAPNAPDTIRLRDATQTALDTDIAATRQAARAIDINVCNESWTGDARYGFARMPVAGTVTSIHFVAHNNASAAGTVTGAVLGAANALLASDVDLKTGINGTLKAGTLTATVGNRTLAAGALVKVTAAGTTVTGGAGLTCVITYIPT